MEIKVDPQQKFVEVWQTRADQDDAALQTQLKAMCTDWKKKGYLVAVYRSGEEDLYAATRDLLAYNKRRTAEMAVRRENTTLSA